MRLKCLVVVVGWILLAVPQAFAQNLLVNGSFEEGLIGWGGDHNGMTAIVGPFYTYAGAEDGDAYLIMGAVGRQDGTLEQTIATTAGENYTFSFWMAAAGDELSDFNVYWDDNLLLSLTDPDTGSQWVQFSYQVVGTGSDTIKFGALDNTALIALDNVSVTPTGTSTAPEPSSLILMSTGIVALSGVARRRFSSQA